MIFSRRLLGRIDHQRSVAQRMAGARGRVPSHGRLNAWSPSSSKGLVVAPNHRSLSATSRPTSIARPDPYLTFFFGMAGLYFALKNDIKGDLDNQLGKQSTQLLEAIKTSTIVNDARINAQNTKIDGQDRKINGQNGMINGLDYKIDGQNSRIKSMGWWSSAP
jgi:hypothetical protein